MTAVCRIAEPTAGDGRVFLDGGEQPGAQLGMFRLDPAGDPARVTRRSAEPGGDAEASDHGGGPIQPAGIAAGIEFSSPGPANEGDDDEAAPRANRNQQTARTLQSRTCR